LASIKEAILQLQAKGAVKAVQEETNQFTSTLFIVKRVQGQANFQFKESQSLCPISEVQDGRSGSSTQTDPTRRLHDEVSLRTGPPGLRAARRKEGLHETIGFLGSGVRIETQASDWLTLVDKITKNSECKQQHFELYSF
jgi:hypothetical protein